MNETRRPVVDARGRRQRCWKFLRSPRAATCAARCSRSSSARWPQLNEYQAQARRRHRPAARVLSNLERLRTELNSAGALFMQRLRDSEFLNAIKHRSTIPGGTCEFDLPDYRHWLDQPFARALR